MKSIFSFNIVVSQILVLSPLAGAFAQAGTLNCVETASGNPFVTILEDAPQTGSATLIWKSGVKVTANFSQSEDSSGESCQQALTVQKHFGFFYESGIEITGSGTIGKSGTRCAGMAMFPTTFSGIYFQPTRVAYGPGLAITCEETY